MCHPVQAPSEVDTLKGGEVGSMGDDIAVQVAIVIRRVLEARHL